MKHREKTDFVRYIRSNANRYEGEKTISRSEVCRICEENDFNFPQWLMKEYKTDKRGVYSLPEFCFLTNAAEKIESKEVKFERPVENVSSVTSDTNEMNLEGNIVPEVDPNYVRFGYHEDLVKILGSKCFYPVYIAGLSGNGKTYMVEQVCAQLKRALVRVNITKETDEDDLLGGFRLVNGETKFFEGPVIKAMKAGAVLLLDEVHLAQMTIMCLQPVLEGKGVFLKKINKFVEPAPGFNVVATANTKGKFSEVGNFAGANIQDEAFLDRFAITLEQEYPSIAVEKKIIKNVFSEHNINNDELVGNLATFANNVRKIYLDGGIDEVISTRRLVDIAKAYTIFEDHEKAIELCTNRFDENVKMSLKMFWDKLFVKEESFEETDRATDVVEDALSDYTNAVTITAASVTPNSTANSSYRAAWNKS
jgi:hypothetical protein